MLEYPQDDGSLCCCYAYRINLWLRNCLVHCVLHVIRCVMSGTCHAEWEYQKYGGRGKKRLTASIHMDKRHQHFFMQTCFSLKYTISVCICTNSGTTAQHNVISFMWNAALSTQNVVPYTLHMLWTTLHLLRFDIDMHLRGYCTPNWKLAFFCGLSENYQHPFGK